MCGMVEENANAHTNILLREMDIDTAMNQPNKEYLFRSAVKTEWYDDWLTATSPLRPDSRKSPYS